jgi:predicted nucleotidyltransferase
MEGVMQERFAKLFDTPTSQVLVYMDIDTDEDETVLHQITQIDGMQSDMSYRFSGESQSENALTAFEKYTQEHADKYAKSIIDLLGQGEP